MAKDTATTLASPQSAGVVELDDHPQSMPDASITPPYVASAKTTQNGDVAAYPANAPESQTDHKTTGASSGTASKDPPSKDLSGAPSGSTASPYGTRSRNRTGTSRINYAEDKEMEIEFELQPKDEGRKPTRAHDMEIVNPEPVRAITSARRAQASDVAQNNHPVSAQKEQIPGTSTFSAVPMSATNGPAQPSKKRKANPPAVAQSMQNTPNPQQSAIGGQSVTRGASSMMHDQVVLRDSNILTFDHCGGRLEAGKMIADDGTVLGVNDHVYLICEPPGEPYYLGRIMEFLHTNNDSKLPIDSLRVNWYYRPKDIGRKVNDTRQVFASMHSDTSPLTALRGKCEIKHKSEVENLDDLRKMKDHFWYEKLYDRYIHRYYEVIPTHQVVNVPSNVKKVLNDRWKYILVEAGRGKELTSAVKSCKRCSGYCASNDSVDCAVCSQTYHMNCVRPPLLKKPSRGFAWACGPCSRAQERKLEARNTPNMAELGGDVDEEELADEEEDDHHLAAPGIDTGRTSPDPSSDDIHPGTEEQIHQASLWPYRYLGVHCRVEDALDYDDRIYPRASSRLGPRHQANVIPWHGRPVELVKPTEIKKKYVKGGGKKDAKLSKETLAAIEADKLAREKRPKWVMDEPVGYVHRGEDYSNDDPNNTARLLFVLPKVGEVSSLVSRGEDDEGVAVSLEDREKFIDEYIELAKPLANRIGVPDHSCNFMDKALEILTQNNYDVDKSIKQLALVNKKVLKEPELTATELKKFEEAVGKYGSELLSVRRHVKTVSYGNIVRFYYVWKKSPRGQQIWGNFASRKGKKEAKKAEANVGKLQDDVADEHDDSAFDNEKAMEKRRAFQCKFCSTRHSRQWRRAPNTTAGTTITADSTSKGNNKDKGAQFMVALCRRCAELWRRYAIQWEDIDEVAKKVAQAGGRAYKRRIDEELLKELVAANENMNLGGPDPIGTASTSTGGTPVPPSQLQVVQEPPKKKLKVVSEKDLSDGAASNSGGVVTTGQKKKAIAEKPAGPPPAPMMPKPRILPCAICHELEPGGDQLLACKECRMSVHRNCYGIVGELRGPNKWVCDMCSNDKNPQVSIKYECTLCSVLTTSHDFVEPPKPTHKKKTEKEREKERQEREIAQNAADFYRKKQEELNRPLDPREPLKRTINNNWVHVTCAVFTPEVKFGNAKALEPSEGIPSIPSARYDELCVLCSKSIGACVGCHTCRKPAHVECANQHGWILGFDIAPVKGSRRDQHNIVNINGEVGTMAAAIWCRDHMQPKSLIHKMHEIVSDEGLNALQLYVQNYKQADLTLTGTVRKANLISQSTKAVTTSSTFTRRVSTTTAPTNGSQGVQSKELADGDKLNGISDNVPKKCATCQVDVTPKWWPFPPASSVKPSTVTDATSTSASKRPENDANGMKPGSTGTNVAIVDVEMQDADRTPADGEPTGENVALAAAALNENTKSTDPVEYQCHKCHFNKVVKEPTPPPPPVIPPPQVTVPQPLPILSPVNAIPAAPSPNPMQAPPHHFPWPPQPARSPQGPYNDWPRSTPLPPQSVHVHQYASSPSPHMTALQHPSTQSYDRQHTPGSRPSPQQNGYSRPPISNTYSPSPHHMVTPNPTHLPNGIYASYSAARPPQHLTNGGPAPRAPENPFSQSSHLAHHRPPYGVPHNSPPAVRDQGMSREPQNQQLNGVRPNDNGRVGGGASASPSLRNLLS